MKLLNRLMKMTDHLGLSKLLMQANAVPLGDQQQLELLNDCQAFDLSGRNDEQGRSANDQRLLAIDSSYLNQFCVDKVAIGIFQVGSDMRIKYVNECGASMLGYSPDELSTMSIQDFDPNFIPKFSQEQHKNGHKDYFIKFDSTHRRKDGTEYPVELTVNCLKHTGQEVYVLFAQDLSERRKVEQQFQESLTGKKLLLQEVHHRMRNNLQIVSNLLGLQSDFIEEEQTRRFFQESRDRIWSMALIHEKLSMTSDFVYINLADYLENLTKSLFRSYVTDFERISYTVESDDITVGIAQAVPCGIIVNELFSNSLKHAFPAGRQGKIAVRCCSEIDGRISLMVADSGVGIQSNLDSRDTEKFGLQLVTMFVQQLRGEIERENTEGTSFRITFKSHDSQ